MLPHTHVTFRCGDAAIQRLYDEAVRRCAGNLNRFGDDLVLVEGGGYEKIWLETQPMGGEMYARYNMEAALNNQLLFMRHQRADGRMPGSIQRIHEVGQRFRNEVEAYAGTAPKAAVMAEFNKFQGFCFPWSALNVYFWLGEDRAYLDRLADCLERFDAYLWRVRDSNGDGLLESWCVYDTGEDHAVRYGDSPVYCTADTPPEGYDVVPMASMDVTSFSYAARDTLCEISRIRGDGREGEWREKADAVARGLREKLWDDVRGALFDRDKYGNTIDVLCHNTLRCMYWGSISREMVDRFVQEHLLNPDEFWTMLPLPSVAANDPAFRNAPENNWSGQCEGLTYQRAILALERYGYEKLVTRLGRKLMQAVIAGGYVFTQQFDPFTGKPSIVDPQTKQPLPPDTDRPIQCAYGPTILSVLEYIAHIWGVTMVRGEVWFSMAGGMACEYELGWGVHVYRVVSDGRIARAFADGHEIFCGECGMRLVTDQAGKRLRTVEIE